MQRIHLKKKRKKEVLRKLILYTRSNRFRRIIISINSVGSEGNVKNKTGKSNMDAEKYCVKLKSFIPISDPGNISTSEETVVVCSQPD